MQEVVKHIVKLMEDFKDQTGEQVVLIGHNVLNDIEALFLNQATYIDTTNFRFKSDQKGLIKKLKSLASKYLNAEIQEGFHSSIVDAKAAMALFTEFKDSKEGFFGDNTIQIFDQGVCHQNRNKKVLKKLIKRSKK